MINTDLQLKQDIQEELAWDPKINAAQIEVIVEDGATRLRGHVDTYAEKWAAEDACRRVSGLRSLADDLAVRLPPNHVRKDSELTTAVLNALQWDVLVPNTVHATVQAGVVNLTGSAKWNFQRTAALRAVRNLTGVVAVHSGISLESNASAKEVHEQIRSALRRQAVADSNAIHVETAGGKVTLTGHASSWQSIEDAASAAWAAPGVTEVIDQVKLMMEVPE